MTDRELEGLRSRLCALGVRAYSVPSRDLDDVVQTTFLLYWARRDEVQDPAAWMVATFGRQCLMYWRSKRASREEESGLEIEPASARGASPERGLVSHLALKRALATLPDRQRRLVCLRVLDGLSTSQAAAELGYTRHSIQQTFRRALARLREALESSDGPGKPQRLMTTRELAEASGIPVQTVEHYRRRGLLPVVGSGKTSRLRYPRSRGDAPEDPSTPGQAAGRVSKRTVEAGDGAGPRPGDRPLSPPPLRRGRAPHQARTALL